MCRLRWLSSIVGRDADQSCGMVSAIGDGSVSSEVEESDSMESPHGAIILRITKHYKLSYDSRKSQYSKVL